MVCLASGPSLTADDVAAIRAAGLHTIVTNTTFRDAPWADVVIGMDHAWWNAHDKEVQATFAGDKLTTATYPCRSVKTLRGLPGFFAFGNSGADAISLAIFAGASRVILLGFDCSKSPAGKAHHHEDHPKPLSNCRSITQWPAKFARVARYAKTMDCEVLNASRRTILDCFVRVSLEDALAHSEAGIPEREVAP